MGLYIGGEMALLSTHGSLPREHQVFCCQSWAGRTQEKASVPKLGIHRLAQWAMLLSFTSLTLLRQTQSVKAENDTKDHHENQDIKLVLIPL